MQRDEGIDFCLYSPYVCLKYGHDKVLNCANIKYARISEYKRQQGKVKEIFIGVGYEVGLRIYQVMLTEEEIPSVRDRME